MLILLLLLKFYILVSSSTDFYSICYLSQLQILFLGNTININHTACPISNKNTEVYWELNISFSWHNSVPVTTFEFLSQSNNISQSKILFSCPNLCPSSAMYANYLAFNISCNFLIAVSFGCLSNLQCLQCLKCFFCMGMGSPYRIWSKLPNICSI